MLANTAVFTFISFCLVAVHMSYGNVPTDLGAPTSNNLQIIGGKSTTIEKHPYQVSITLSSGSFLAGSILNKNWIITAASPLSYITESLTARVGSNHTESGGTLYKISKTIINPNFDSSTYYYDLALHKLSKPLKFGKTVKKINLPKKALSSGAEVVVSGWGATSTVNAATNPFKEITMKAVSETNCTTAYENLVGYSTSKSQVCAIASDYNNGPFYDFGAPLVAKNMLYGQYSFRYIYSGVPAIFSNVLNVVSWVKKTIKK